MTCDIIASGAIPSASANRKIVLSVGELVPRSIIEM